jgi:hypothetical protein
MLSSRGPRGFAALWLGAFALAVPAAAGQGAGAAPPAAPAQFDLSISELSLTVAQAEKSAVSVSTAPKAGFNFGITLAVIDPPSGITPEFSPDSIPAPGSGISTLVLNVSSAATAGTYSIKVQGTASNGAMQQKTVTLTVNQAPSFSLALSKPSITVMQGDSTAVAISGTSIAGFSTPVALSVSVPVEGISPHFEPPAVIPGSNPATLTLAVSTGVATTTYEVTITGVAGALTRTVDFDLTVTAAPPAPSITLSAANASVEVPPGGKTTATISVTASPGVTSAIVLSAEGQPSGVAVTFDPSQIPASAPGNSNVSFSASPNAAPGPFPISIKGTSGSLSSATQITLTVQQPPAAAQQGPPPASFDVSPNPLRQTSGKYPSTLSIVLMQKNCDSSNASLVAPSDANTTYSYSVTPAGPGLTVSGTPTAGMCRLVATLAIDGTAAAPGSYVVEVIKSTTPKSANGSSPGATTTTEDLGYGMLNLAFPTAGPTPGKPAVDAMFWVLSKHLCSDNFGNHVGRDVFCVEVKIGNDSGYPIQLAGIGFQLSTAGESAASGDLAEKIPNLSYQSVRAAAVSSQSRTFRNILVNGTGGLGVLMASFSPFFHSAWNAARWSAGYGIVGTTLPKVIGTVVPDLTVAELQNLDDESFRDGVLIPNNTEIRTMVYLERRDLEGVGAASYEYWCGRVYDSHADEIGKCKKSKDDPTAVKLALGDIVIVGDQLDFLQRIVVDPNVTSQQVTAPGQISNIAATTSAITVTFNGTVPPVSLLSGATAILQGSTSTAAIQLSISSSTGSSNPLQVVFNPPSGKSLVPGTYTLAIPGLSPSTFTLPLIMTCGSATAAGVTVTFNGPPPSSTTLAAATAATQGNLSIPLHAGTPAANTPQQVTFTPISPATFPSGTFTLTVPGLSPCTFTVSSGT